MFMRIKASFEYYNNLWSTQYKYSDLIFNNILFHDNNNINISETSENAMKLSDIVLEMISENKSCTLYYNDQIYIDCNIHDALENVCVILGLSTESFTPELQRDNLETKIYLYC